MGRVDMDGVSEASRLVSSPAAVAPLLSGALSDSIEVEVTSLLLPAGWRRRC